MTLILLQDIQNSFWSIMSQLTQLIIPLIVIFIFFHFTRSILFENR